MCTGIRFTDPKGNMYFGRNLDWSCDFGERVVITPTGWSPNSPFGAIARVVHPVYGMGIVENDTPLYFDCANDAGLAVAGLNFEGYARYEEGPAEGKTNVCAWELSLWVTSCFSTVDEVETALANVAVVNRPISERYACSPLHWLVADARRSIVVEYMSDGMHVHRNGLDVLTNQPPFAYHAENVRNYVGCTPAVPPTAGWAGAELRPQGAGAGMLGIPGDCTPVSRFVRAAYHNAHYPQKENEAQNVSRLFHTLASVAMVDGAAQTADGPCEVTVYTGGVSTRTNTYYWSTYDNPAIRSVALADHNTTGRKLVQVA